MKKSLILHIGMGKTGTTALQEFFWLNRAQLKKDGILYPSAGTVAHAHHLLSPFKPDNLKERWNWSAASEWAPKLSKTNCDYILLSSELIAWTPRDEVAEFCRFLQRWFNLTVVIYLRRQDNMVIANYNQLVKVGSQRRELEKTWEEDAARFDYWKIIEPWATILGNGNVIARPYEKQQFYRGDIRRDFMHHVFGRNDPANYVMSSAHFNPRLNSFAIAYKFRLYDLFTDRGQVALFNEALLGYSSELDRSENAIFLDQPLLSPEIRNEIISRSNGSNGRVAQELMGRRDGALFIESLPGNSESWTPPILSADHAKGISHYIVSFSAKLARLLFDEIHDGLTSRESLRRTAAEFLRPSLPIGIIGGIKERDVRTFLKRKSAHPAPANTPLLLISVNLPAVTIDDYSDQIRRYFGDYIVLDYADRPMGSSGISRKGKALRDCFRFVSLIHESEHAVCIHGHFMPLKYRLIQSTLRKKFVTWVRDPVDRLVEHYWLWKNGAEGDKSGKLRLRMLQEDWSLERFAFSPEIRNLYSKYLWGFPLQQFDFVGIAEFRDTELQRFSRDVLGNTQTSERGKEVPVANEAFQTVDTAFRTRVEQYHAADVRLYRNALRLRRSKL